MLLADTSAPPPVPSTHLHPPPPNNGLSSQRTEMAWDCRNVTLRGPAGTQADDRPVLDFGLVDGAVELCSSCMISIQDLVLKQERRGSGPTYDFFTGQPGSRIRSIRTYRIRAGCTPAPVQIRALEALKRSSLFPNSTSSQHVELRNVSYKVRHHTDPTAAGCHPPWAHRWCYCLWQGRPSWTCTSALLQLGVHVS